MKNTKSKALKALKGLKDKVIDVTSDIISAPVRAIHDSNSRLADKKYKAYKMVNDSKGVQDKGNESDPLFRARVSMRNEQKKALERKK